MTPLSIWIVTFLVLGKGIFYGNLGILVLWDSSLRFLFKSFGFLWHYSSRDTSSLLSKEGTSPSSPLSLYWHPQRGAPHYCREGMGFCPPLGHSPYLPGWERWQAPFAPTGGVSLSALDGGESSDSTGSPLPPPHCLGRWIPFWAGLGAGLGASLQPVGGGNISFSLLFASVGGWDRAVIDGAGDGVARISLFCIQHGKRDEPVLSGGGWGLRNKRKRQ